MKSLPKNLDIVFAFVGDSTMTSALIIAILHAEYSINEIDQCVKLWYNYIHNYFFMSQTPEEYSRFRTAIFSHAMMGSSMTMIEQETGLSSADIIRIIQDDLLRSANKTQRERLEALLPKAEAAPAFEFREGEPSSEAIKRLVEFARSIIHLPWLSGGQELTLDDKETRVSLFESRFGSYLGILGVKNDLDVLEGEITALSGKRTLIAPPAAILGIFPSAHGLRDAFCQIAQLAVQERIDIVRRQNLERDELQGAETRAISLDDVRQAVRSPRPVEPARPPLVGAERAVPEYAPQIPLAQPEKKGGILSGLFGGKRHAEEEARMRQEQEARYREALVRRDDHLHTFLSSRVFGSISDIRQKLESVGYRVTGLPQRGNLPPLAHEYQTNVTLAQEGRQYSVKLKLVLGGNRGDWTYIYSVNF